MKNLALFPPLDENGHVSQDSKRTHSGRFTLLSADKLRGGYYTSLEIAQWMCDWALRSSDETVLEPSCGDGAFVQAAATRLRELGATSTQARNAVLGIEIVQGEAEKARERMRKVLGSKGGDCIELGDFFSWCQSAGGKKYDAVVGNPPFIRYQTFPEPSRTLAMTMMVDAGLVPNKLTNIWVPFVVAACGRLKTGGKLALVLPAELLQVTYASQLRSYLVSRFRRINVVTCNSLFFANAEQEVVLLLAEGLLAKASEKNECRVAMSEARTVHEITSTEPIKLLAKAAPKSVDHGSEKWLKFFLSAREIEFMRRLKEEALVSPLSDHASVDVGVVTGKNEFFVLSQEQVNSYQLGGYTIPLVGRASHLRGARLTHKEWKSLADDGERVYLLYVSPAVNGSLSQAGQRYVRSGEDQEFNVGYKCSIRTPWYSVPSVWQPDCFFFRQIYDFPRLVLNEGKATSTDTIHRMKCKGNPKLVVESVYTHLTAASAEIEGRSYGGGVLELEPTEAERLLMPSTLGGGLPVEECDRLIRNGRLQELLEENDRLILGNKLGLSKSEFTMLKDIWEKMRNRRMSRTKKRRKTEAVDLLNL
jgi:adenine-specific DNA methylase